MLSVQQIQNMNVAMLGLGAPIEKDGQGYNKPDFARMEMIGMLSAELTLEEAYVALSTLQRYRNTQLKTYKEEIEATLEAYTEELAKKYPEENREQRDRALNRAEAGIDRNRNDYRHRTLRYYGDIDGCAIVAFQEYVENVDIRPFEGKWTKAPNGKTAIRIPYEELDRFLEYVRGVGEFGYEAPQELRDAWTLYKAEKGAEEPEVVHLIPLNTQNDYGYDLYELDTNKQRLNQRLWNIKGEGMTYLDSRTNKDKVIISTNDRMFPKLLIFLKENGVDVSAVENAPKVDLKAEKNKSGNTLIDVSRLDLPFSPYPFQIEDAQTVVGKKKALLGHDMGCGKTFISALVGMSIPEKKIVICPETLRLNWKRELGQAHKGADIRIVYSKDSAPQFGEDWTIMGYKTAVKFEDLIKEAKFDCMFVDEAHKCKAVDNYGKPSSQQAKTVMSLAQNMTYTYLLTGTPMPTRNRDLYNELVMLGEINSKQRFAFHTFGVKFCAGHKNDYGWDYEGSSNTEELHEILQRYMTRRLKSEVLPHLIKQRIPIVIDPPLSKEYRDIERRLHHMENGDTYMGLAMKGRNALSKCKVDSAIEFAETILEADEPVVLVAEFDETLDRMMEQFGDDACQIRGGMSDTAKQKAIDDFQSGRKKVCCINLIAAGVGITLTNAHNMVICDFDWTPANMTQVEDRICRTGQNEQCNIYYICHEKAILDDIFLGMITSKSENIDRVVDNAENTVDLVEMRRSGGSLKSGEEAFLAKLKARIEADNAANGEVPKPKRKRSKSRDSR